MIQTPTGILINTNNTVYATASNLTSILVWPEGSINPTKNISSNLQYPYGVFATVDGDVYADNGYLNHRVEKWTPGASASITAMYVPGLCGGLFVDIYGNIYCSLPGFSQVLKRATNNDANTSVIVAGTSTYGSASNMLSSPYGIFVDIDLSLYVADFGNSRVQRFPSGQLVGTTVAGDGAPTTIALNQPTGVILDADGYLFISDRSNNRIVAGGPNGFRCIVGCTRIPGPAANQLVVPYDLSFDSHGNLYVTDPGNNRIQKFTLAKNSSCRELLDTYAFL